jgi:hypothetical protein
VTTTPTPPALPIATHGIVAVAEYATPVKLKDVNRAFVRAAHVDPSALELMTPAFPTATISGVVGSVAN